MRASPLRLEYVTVQNVRLLEVTLDELGGEEPVAGFEVTIRGIRYRVMEAQPPKTKSSKWKRRAPSPEPRRWRLLVQEMPNDD